MSLTSYRPKRRIGIHVLKNGCVQIFSVLSTNPSPELNQVPCWRHQFSQSESVIVVLSSPSYTLTHNLQLTQTCCRCLHSRRNRTPHTDPMNSRTSSVERSRSTNLPPSPMVNTCLQCLHNEHNRHEKNLMNMY